MAEEKDLLSVVGQLGPQFAARSREHDENDSFVKENYDLLKEQKVFSAPIPKEIGGGGVAHSKMCDFLRELARYCGSTALSVSMHQHLVAAQIFNHLAGRPAPVLEKVVAGELVLVSTGANDWLDSNGSMEKVDGGYRVTAKKPFASGCPVGNVLVTSARYDDPKDGPRVLHFPVPLSAKEVRIDENWKAHGMRGTGSHTVVLEGAFVPDEAVALSRPRGEYHPIFNIVVTVALPLIASVYLGVAEAAAEKARARARKQPDEPSLPYILGEMGNALTTARLAQQDMVRLANDLVFEPSLDLTTAMVERKTLAVNAAIETTQKALESVGGAGFFRELGLEILVRDARAGHFHPLQEKRQHLFTGRVAMGLDPVTGKAI